MCLPVLHLLAVMHYETSASSSWMPSLVVLQEITNMVATEDHVVVEFIGRGVNTGPLHMPTGDVPPTGRSVEIHFTEVRRIANGKNHKLTQLTMTHLASCSSLASSHRSKQFRGLWSVAQGMSPPTANHL